MDRPLLSLRFLSLDFSNLLAVFLGRNESLVCLIPEPLPVTTMGLIRKRSSVACLFKVF